MNSKQRLALVGAAGAVLLVAAVGLAAAHGGGMPFGRWNGASERPGFNASGDPIAGSFVTLSADAAHATFSNIDLKDANSTHPLVASVQLALPDGATAAASTTRSAYALSDGAGDRLAVLDSPRGDILATSANGATVTIVLPEGATLAVHEAVAHWSPAGATVTYATGQVANVVLSPNATIAQDGQTLTIGLPAHGSLHFGLAGPERGAFGFGGPHGGEFDGDRRPFERGPSGFGGFGRHR